MTSESEGDSTGLTTKLPEEKKIPKTAPTRPAYFYERFSAFLVDSVLFIYFIAAYSLVLKHFLKIDWTSIRSINRPIWILFGSTGIALYFLYYLFFEGVLTASPGKLLGGLRVEKKKGGVPSLSALLIRNLFRLIDTPLFFFTGIGLMEATRKRQRLGDLMARTVIVRRLSSAPLTGDSTVLAGSTRRTISFFIDLFLIAALGYGLLLMIPVSWPPRFCFIALNLLPLILLIAFTAPEWLFQTSFGKIILGMRVVQEDGYPAKFSSLFCRNLFRLFDMNPIGYFCTFASSHRQRPGDIAAGTLVIRDRRNRRALLALPFMLLLAGASLLGGWKNPDSFLRKNVRLSILDRSFRPIPLFVERELLKEFRVESLELGISEREVSMKKVFAPGGVVYLMIQASGYEVREKMAWIQAGLIVRDTKGNPILDQPNIINASVPVGERKATTLVTRFALHPDTPSGHYEAEVRLKDLFTKVETEEKVLFKVR